jgi:energy-coupling factor transporter ATP-binding protein EcfA2
MARIIKIDLVNYRAYYDKYELPIQEGKNLLIYGENGSGKSSLYEGLKQFYIASDATSEKKLSRHLNVPELYEVDEGPTLQTEVYVKVTYQEANGNLFEKTFGVPNGDVEGDQIIRNFSLQSVFLSYRELLGTHLMENLYNSFEFQTKFANLLITQILANKINSGTNQIYKRDWDRLYVSGKGSRPNRAEKEAILTNFDIGFKNDISEVNLYLNEILKHFEPNLEIILKVEDSYIEYENQNYPVFQVSIKGKFYDMDLSENEESHLSILNEARLSALAISIFFAGIITTNQKQIPHKFLFLDDIFIGLDMSNRKPLLEILTKYKIPNYIEVVDDETGLRKTIVEVDVGGELVYEPNPFFNQYQIFITTYDKHWFEIAKNYLNENQWQSVEMFSHFDENLNFELPLIFTSSLGYLEKAEIYFKKNKEYKDYPAAANYLRKECEQQLKRILFGNYLLKNGDKGTTQLREELDELKQSFEKLLDDLGFTTNMFDGFANIIKSTLNPLSHDNLQKPIYKKELEEAFELVKNLKMFSKTLIVDVGVGLVVSTNNGGIVRTTHLKIANEVYKYDLVGVSKFTPVFINPVKFEEGNNTTKLKIPECSIEKAYDMIHHSVFNIQNASNGIDIYPFFILSDSQTLREKLS